MDIAPIKTNRDYLRTLKEIEGLMSAKRNTPEGDRLDVLVTLVEVWEANLNVAEAGSMESLGRSAGWGLGGRRRVVGECNCR